MIFRMSFRLGINARHIHSYGLIEKESVLIERWITALQKELDRIQVSLPKTNNVSSKNGRNGEHSADLEEALEILGEVYHLDPAAAW